MTALKLLTVEQKGSVLVVTPVGDMMNLDEQRLAAELAAIYAQMEQPGVNNLVLDFGQIPYFGSILLGAILGLSRHLPADEGKLALCNVSAVGRDVLHVSRFDTLWPIYDSQEEACDSFEAGA